MDRFARWLAVVTLATAAAFTSSAGAQTRDLKEGTSYKTVKPAQSTEAGEGKVEVVEFFWYACPHCASLEPALKEWAKKQPADVVLRKVHVPFREIRHQQLYYTLETMGKAEALNDAIFDAIHGQKNPLNTPERQADFVAKHGIDRQQFLDTYNSFGVRTKMSRATQLGEGYGIEGVPAFGVAGKYLTAPSMAGSNAAALDVVDQLVARERKPAKSAK